MQKTVGSPGILQPSFYLYSNHPRPALSIFPSTRAQGHPSIRCHRAQTLKTQMRPGELQPLRNLSWTGRFWIHPCLYRRLFQKSAEPPRVLPSKPWGSAHNYNRPPLNSGPLVPQHPFFLVGCQQCDIFDSAFLVVSCTLGCFRGC